MNTKTLSTRALNTIDQYLHFKVGNASCSIPYFNNKTLKARGALSAYIGKGSPKEIVNEVQAISVKAHVDTNAFTDESLKKLLVDSNIGIDCSGLSYYILNAENEELGKGSLDKHLSFVQSKGFFAKIISSLRSSFRPIENTGVRTLADEKNSNIIPLNEIKPGDMVTMLDGPDGNDRNHILIIHQVDPLNYR